MDLLLSRCISYSAKILLLSFISHSNQISIKNLRLNLKLLSSHILAPRVLWFYKLQFLCCWDFFRLLPHIRGNVGFVFTRGDLVEVRDKLMENKVRAPARAGAIAPCPVIIPAQNTGFDPNKTSFFQALSIPTKISKGTIEIIVSCYYVF